MGVDLNGCNETVHLNWACWRHLLKMAHEFGWQPAGTEEPTWPQGLGPKPILGAKWYGGYFTNDFQKVTDSDARQIGIALLRSVLAKATKKYDEKAKMVDEMNIETVLGFATFALTSGFTIA
jgi:hypothetical protein